MRGRDWALLGLVVGLGLLVPALWFDLRIPDEPRVAHTSLEMIRTGDLIVPTVNGKTFLQTPPLHYWILGLWLRLVDCGIDGLARVPSVLFSIGTIWLTARMASRRSGDRAGFLSAGVLAGTIGFWDGGQRVVVDGSMTFFVTLALQQISEALAARDPSFSRGACTGVAMGCAFLSKGLPALVIIAGAILLPLCFLRRFQLRPWLGWGAALLLGLLAAALPWTTLLYLRDPLLVWELLYTHVSARFLDGAHHDPSNFDFAHRALLKLLPWGVALPLAIAQSFRTIRANREPRAGDRVWRALLLSWFLVPLTLLLVSRSKRNIYLLPLFPAFGMLIGLWLDRLIERGHTQRRIVSFVWVAAILLPVGGFIQQHLSTEDSTLRPLGSRVAALEHEGLPVLGYQLYEREESALAWYLRHPFENLEDGDSLADALKAAGAHGIVVGEEAELDSVLSKTGHGAARTRVEARQQLRRRILEARRLTPPE